MRKKFKKIYVEITNVCNLSCSFCKPTNRVKKYITPIEMEEILKKIHPYTGYLYLHVKGEPLLHPQLKEILDLCQKYHQKVNITTNGTLLLARKKELSHPVIRQINISLHSENEKEHYLDDIFDAVEEFTDKVIVYRFWTMQENKLDQKSTNIVERIKEYYQLSPEIVEKIKKENHILIKNHIYIDKANEFVWPSLSNNYNQEHGFCYALKDQLAILVDGTIVPCCLDGDGIIKLGNIYQNTLEEVMRSSRYQTIKQGFQNRQVSEELCKRCSFKDALLTNVPKI